MKKHQMDDHDNIDRGDEGNAEVRTLWSQRTYAIIHTISIPCNLLRLTLNVVDFELFWV